MEKRDMGEDKEAEKRGVRRKGVFEGRCHPSRVAWPLGGGV